MLKAIDEYKKWAKKNCKKGEVLKVFTSDKVFMVTKIDENEIVDNKIIYSIE